MVHYFIRHFGLFCFWFKQNSNSILVMSKRLQNKGVLIKERKAMHQDGYTRYRDRDRENKTNNTKAIICDCSHTLSHYLALCIMRVYEHCRTPENVSVAVLPSVISGCHADIFLHAESNSKARSMTNLSFQIDGAKNSKNKMVQNQFSLSKLQQL